MTDTDVTTPDVKRGLSSMLLPELRGVAGDLGIKGISGMRKGELIEAIRSQQSGGGKSSSPAEQTPSKSEATVTDTAGSEAKSAETKNDDAPKRAQGEAPADGRNGQGERGERRQRNSDRNDRGGNAQGGDKAEKSDSDKGYGNKADGGNKQRNQNNNQQNNRNDDDGEGGGRRGRRRRERRRGNRNDRDGDGEPQLNEGDAVAPVAGILDVLDNYAFVRTSGYLPGRTTSTCR